MLLKFIMFDIASFASMISILHYDYVFMLSVGF